MPVEFRRVSDSPAQTHAIGAALGRVLRPGDAVLLEGDLGAGKTAMARGVAEGLGIDPNTVSSPTFVLVHEHPHPTGGTGMIHVDAYRLGKDESDTLGLDSARASAAALVIEWPGRLPPAFLEGINPGIVRLDQTGRESRLLTFILPDSWASRPGWARLLAEPNADPPSSVRSVS
jgi:tRNA threonylcarbamoyladenosine biosynthesis protein TsaE